MKNYNPKLIGEVSVAQIIARLLKRGFAVALPFGDSARYDLLVEGKKKGKIVRVQCKTGIIRNGAIHFPTRSCANHAHTKSRDYRGDADYFGIYCPQNDKVYFILVSKVGTSFSCLRVKKPKNHQNKKVRWAKDYEF